MDTARFQRWLDDYVAAWRSYDPEAIAALFTEDAVYRYHPWDEGAEAVSGRDRIAADWVDEPDAPDSWTAEYAPWALDGQRGVALGVSRYLAPDGTVEREYHNVFLCEFGEDGRCSSFTELYMRRDS